MLRDPQQLAQFVHDHCQQLQQEATNARRARRHPLRDLGARRGTRHTFIQREPSQTGAQR